MKLPWSSKTNGEAAQAAPGPTKSDELGRSLEPLLNEVQTLKMRLDEQNKKRNETKSAYDEAVLNAANGGSTDEALMLQDELRRINIAVEGMQQLVVRKEAELAPLKQALWAATEAERKEREERETAAFVESTRAQIYEAFTEFMRWKERFLTLMSELQKRSPHDWQRIRMDLDMKVANMAMKGGRQNGRHF